MPFGAHSSRGCAAAVCRHLVRMAYWAGTLGRLFATTVAVVVVTWRRQFGSNAWRAMGS
jgi:hypothetical protein